VSDSAVAAKVAEVAKDSVTARARANSVFFIIVLQSGGQGAEPCNRYSSLDIIARYYTATARRVV
jgi:hypothetical protein